MLMCGRQVHTQQAGRRLYALNHFSYSIYNRYVSTCKDWGWEMIYLLIILALLSAWEEVQQLVQRGSWKREDYRYPEWKTPHHAFWKNFDSHHLCFGLFVLVMMIAFVGGFTPCLISTPLFQFVGISLTRMITLPIDIIIYWYLYFKVRNIGMHIIFKRKPLWEYLYKL